MDTLLLLLMVLVIFHSLRVRYQRMHVMILAKHLSAFQIEKHMESLTQGYARAIADESETRQIQILETYEQTERAISSQVQALANSFRQEPEQNAAFPATAFCIPYAERFLPALTRDFRALLAIHAAGFKTVVDNDNQWSSKDRAFHLSAELYLFQHSCHWYCKSRNVANARLMMRHQVSHQKVLDSVSPATRTAYLKWLKG
ncbi:hypothetical protein [Orrella sp. 11846]|uniref:hypothetical protein n=1 Tax=Orrella sp. 11846 TaxID=3409913 RepID=UPI003B5B8CF8